ncbi:MAG: hypothetical protein LBI79_04650 [Nitrososphaerota archaeon]|nr:hypothetical protein [Nitrososphaerota archaeon]
MQAEKQNEPPVKTCKANLRVQIVDELRIEWKSMWIEQFNDKVRAEGVSVADYERLKVSRGTILHATRSCETPEFKDILKENLVENPDRYIQPNNVEGGWRKFIKTNITKGTFKTKRVAEYAPPPKPKGKQPKKGGRGWLHTA